MMQDYELKDVPSVTTTSGIVDIKWVSTPRYTLQWNFGKSQCSFDTAQDVVDFLCKDLQDFHEDKEL